MRLLSKPTNTPEVSVVYMSIHSKEALEYCAHNIHEVAWKGDPILLWENSWVVHLQNSKFQLAPASSALLLQDLIGTMLSNGCKPVFGREAQGNVTLLRSVAAGKLECAATALKPARYACNDAVEHMCSCQC